MIALSAIRSKSYSLTTGELGRVPSENNKTRSRYEIPGTRPHREMYDEDGKDDCGGLGWRTVPCGFGHWSDHWGGPFGGSQLDDGCCVARHSWSVTA